jgi:hypothetical protein
MADRPQVGPADPETRRKKLREELDKPTRAEGVAPRPEAKPADAKKKGFLEEVADALNPNKKRERRVGEKGQRLMDAVDKGIEEGDKENRFKRK